jgi:hypothetical protein
MNSVSWLRSHWKAVGIALVLFFVGIAIGSNSEDTTASQQEVATETTLKTVTVGRAQLAALSKQRVTLAARAEQLDSRALRLSARDQSLDARAARLSEREQALRQAGPPPAPAEAPAASSSSGCDPNYTPCVPDVPYDLDCSDIGHSVEVIGGDPNGFDGDGDGFGCETYG